MTAHLNDGAGHGNSGRLKPPLPPAPPPDYQSAHQTDEQAHNPNTTAHRADRESGGRMDIPSPLFCVSLLFFPEQQLYHPLRRF